jgi:hypothetical protein
VQLDRDKEDIRSLEDCVPRPSDGVLKLADGVAVTVTAEGEKEDAIVIA